MKGNKLGWLALFLVCAVPLVLFVIQPQGSLQFILADAPLNGWLGSLYGGWLVVGSLAVFGFICRFIRDALLHYENRREN